MYKEKYPIREVFTPENVKKQYEDDEILYCDFDSEYKETIILLVRESKDLYRLESFHIDAFDPHSTEFKITDYECIQETYLTKNTVKNLIDILNGEVIKQ